MYFNVFQLNEVFYDDQVVLDHVVSVVDLDHDYSKVDNIEDYYFRSTIPFVSLDHFQVYFVYYNDVHDYVNDSIKVVVIDEVVVPQVLNLDKDDSYNYSLYKSKRVHVVLGMPFTIQVKMVIQDLIHVDNNEVDMKDYSFKGFQGNFKIMKDSLQDFYVDNFQDVSGKNEDLIIKKVVEIVMNLVKRKHVL